MYGDARCRENMCIVGGGHHPPARSSSSAPSTLARVIVSTRFAVVARSLMTGSVNPPTDKSRQFQNQEPGLRPNRALPPAAHRTATCGFVLDWGTAPPSLGRPERDAAPTAGWSRQKC